MAAAISDTVVSGAPGATTTVHGTGLTGGGPASVVLAGQGADGSQQTTLANPVFSGTTVTFVTPDGARDGLLTITASDASIATVPLRVNSQYVFSSEFIGQGADQSGLVPGELDAILQQASAYADAYVCQGDVATSTLRLLQTSEQAKYKKRTRRVYPRRRPLVSIESFTYIASPALQVQFSANDFILVPDLEYAELVIWSMGYTYIQALASFTMFDAGVNTLTYTAGYTWANYPQVLREAVKIIATELLTYRNIEASGFGGLARVKQGQVQYDRRNEPFAIPDPAKVFLDQLRFVRPA